MGDGGPSNLNPIEYDQKLDRHNRPKFRPSEQIEVLMDGQGGDRNQFRGPGTENPSDVGSPSSGSFASRNRRTIVIPEPTMPNAKKESDPQEEGAGTETNQSFYDMQQR